jgi:toxin FitB
LTPISPGRTLQLTKPSARRSEPTRGPRIRIGTNGIVADVLIDTDLFVDHLRGSNELKPGRDRVHYSVITRAELFAGTSATDLVTTLLAPFREILVDRFIAERAGRVRRDAGIRLPDALIAATALEHGLIMKTRNRRDFDRVPGLRVRSPR